MKIALNALSAQAGGGISAFVNLCPLLPVMDPENEYIAFVSVGQSEILSHVKGRVRVILVPAVFGRTALRIAWEQLVLPLFLLLRRVDLLYSTGNITTLFAPCAVLLLMENSNPYSVLDIGWNRKEKIRSAFLRALGWLSAKKARRIRFLSENSRVKLMQRLQVPASKCVTIPHGFAGSTMVPVRPTLSDGYILTVSVVAPHKNMEVLIRAFSILCARTHYAGKLVIAGDCCYPSYRRRLDELVRTLSLSPRVIFTGKVPHAQIGGWYAAAELYVQTSIEETFGMPVLEALGYGRPVIAPRLGKEKEHDLFLPYEELFGDSCRYYDPFDPESLGRLMQRTLGDEDFQKRSSMGGKKVVRHFSWENTALQLIRALKDMEVVRRAKA